MDQGLLDQLEANYQSQKKAKKVSQPKKQKRPNDSGGIKGVLQSLIPLAGGALGAAAGIPLGPAGIIAGGAAGSAGGEALKQKLQGGPIDRGDIVEQGVLGAIPGLGSGFKALRAGGGAASLIGRGAEQTAAKTATQAAAKTSIPDRLYNKGVITESRSGGFGQGEKVSGGNSLGFRDTEKISKVLDKEGVPGGSASTRQIAVGDRLSAHAKTIDAAVEAKNTAVPEDKIVDILDRVQSSILGKNGKGVTGYIVGNKSHSSIADSYARQLAQVKDARGLLNLRRGLDEDAINYGRNSMAPDPVKEQIAKAFRKEINKDFGELVPEAKKASDSYSKLHDANEFLKQAARDSSNAATQPGAGGVVSRIMTSDTAQAVKSKAGRGMQTLGKAMGSGAEAAPSTVGSSQGILAGLTGGNVARAGMQQGLSRATVQPLIGNDPTAGQESPVTGTTDQSTVAPDPTASMGLDPNMETAPTSQYTKENFLSDIQRDPDNAATYLSIFKEMNDVAQQEAEATGTGGPNVTKVTAQQYGLAQSGSQALQQLTDMISQDPDVVTRTATPGRQLPILGGYISKGAGTGEYDAVGYNIADSLLRLRTGATANESEVRNLQSQIMPRAGDSPETIQTKLAQLQQAFGNVLQTAGASGTSSGTGLTTADGQEIYQ